jgi:hypothetical protein
MATPGSADLGGGKDTEYRAQMPSQRPRSVPDNRIRGYGQLWRNCGLITRSQEPGRLGIKLTGDAERQIPPHSAPGRWCIGRQAKRTRVGTYRPFGSTPPAGHDRHDATRAPPPATWRRPTNWRRRRAGGAHGRERGPVLAGQRPAAWFGVSSVDRVSPAAPGAQPVRHGWRLLGASRNRIGQHSGSATAIRGRCFASSAIQPALKTRQID